MATEGDLPDSCYCFVPEAARGSGGSKSLRKLRICDVASGKLDRGIIGNAIAALTSNFRGNPVQMPAAAKPAATRCLRAAIRSIEGRNAKIPEQIA
jgi:hypothetical protein